MGPSHVLHRSINRSIFATILTLWASLVLAPQATAAMLGLTDAQTYPPPTSGPYAYQTFTPNQPDFLDLGESYVDPVFGTMITRVSNVHPDTGSGILYGINGYWNADASLYLQSNVSGVDLINPATGAIVVPHVPFTIGEAVSFDPVNADVYYYTNGTKLMQYRVSSRSSSVLRLLTPASGVWADRRIGSAPTVAGLCSTSGGRTRSGIGNATRSTAARLRSQASLRGGRASRQTGAM